MKGGFSNNNNNKNNRGNKVISVVDINSSTFSVMLKTYLKCISALAHLFDQHLKEVFKYTLTSSSSFLTDALVLEEGALYFDVLFFNSKILELKNNTSKKPRVYPLIVLKIKRLRTIFNLLMEFERSIKCGKLSYGLVDSFLVLGNQLKDVPSYVSSLASYEVDCFLNDLGLFLNNMIHKKVLFLFSLKKKSIKK